RRVASRRPANAALDQILEAGVAPGAVVVTPGRVKDAASPLRADPGPRLGALALTPVLQDSAVFVVVLGVNLSLVPALEAAEAPDDGVVGFCDPGAERARAVAEELSADQLNILRRIEEAVRGAVDRDEAFAAFDEVEQRLLLVWRDAGRVRI